MKTFKTEKKNLFAAIWFVAELNNLKLLSLYRLVWKSASRVNHFHNPACPWIQQML